MRRKAYTTAGLDQLGPVRTSTPTTFPARTARSYNALTSRMRISAGKRKPPITLPKLNLPPLEEDQP